MSYSEVFMRTAVEMALANVESGKGGPFAALVVKDGRVVGRGTNVVTTANDPTAHAEIQAIRDACLQIQSYQLTDCEIYTTCEPCPMCLGAIYWARPMAVYYALDRHDAAHAGFDDALIYNEIQRNPQERQIAFVQHNKTMATVIFENWRNKADKIKY